MRTGPLLSALGLWLSCGMVLTGGCSSSQAPPPPITVSVSPQAAAVGTGQSTQFSVTTDDTAGVTWSATSGTIDASGYYTAPFGALSATVTVTATSNKDPSKSASATVNVVAPGTVTATANVQVAQYTIASAGAGDVSVQFGQDTSYGLTTWMQPVPQGGGVVSLFVAGMKANTLYHMRGVVRFGDGSQFLDADKTFTTQGLPATQLPTITATTTAGMAPQSGVEMLDLVDEPSTVVPVAVTDLDGNVLWSYNPGLSGVIANPIKLLPTGHFLINFSGQTVDGANSVLQEVNLDGTLIWQMTAADLNKALVASCASTGIGCNLTVSGTHHDFLPLPSGHLIVIAGMQQSISGTTVTGDVIIDLDENHKPVWLWNEFDHLDINRQPYLYPDWTHTNAVIYSPDDGNLIISMRHQNWVVKVDYANGRGLGDILWKLGYQGDFALMNADGTPDSNAADWFFAQHGPSFVSTNTTGRFSLTVFDNGDDRGVTVVTGGTCGVTGQPACFSTVPILGLDETAKTATLSFHPTTPEYSLFGGNAEVLRNGNVEYCETAGGPGTAGDIYEVTQGINAETVWKMVTGGFAYRGQRIPSFYPGVQW